VISVTARLWTVLRRLVTADKPTSRWPHDPGAYSEILTKHDDHLIRDIGQTREELLGPERAFWSEWLKRKAPWQL
jgi:hypothetical protein